ncbi:flagellar hook assembly protein FlgD [Salirhabdus salicampi]|uniref:flagellar hook assembly protein FlgD n=1 Tax=Salirhabdus salicampi TaxID=476102 RepID=UPI0020C1BEF3|nr:flagellar hook assembly protein FlgD [Salirhabdus salicampi]
MTKIDPSLYLSNQKREPSRTTDLGKNEFLKILMTQLQNQDPLNPLEDKEFISQMATFSSLEQLTNISSTMNRFLESQTNAPIVQYSHLIGKSVTYKTYNSEGVYTEDKTSLVDAISSKDGQVQLLLENGEKISTEDMIEIKRQE